MPVIAATEPFCLRQVNEVHIFQPITTIKGSLRSPIRTPDGELGAITADIKRLRGCLCLGQCIQVSIDLCAEVHRVLWEAVVTR